MKGKKLDRYCDINWKAWILYPIFLFHSLCLWKLHQIFEVMFSFYLKSQLKYIGIGDGDKIFSALFSRAL